MKIMYSFLLILVTYHLSSQYKIRGEFQNQKNEVVSFAIVQLLSGSDSTFINSTQSDENGKFFFENIKQSDIIIKVHSLTSDEMLIPVHLDKPFTFIGKIILNEKSTKLDEVVIKEKLDPVLNKSDTIDIKASSFKVNKDASLEDLVTKLPGVTQQNGRLQAHGEDIKQVLVDGKPFMGDDPNTALKNVPAEMVDRIQIFDRRSEQAQFTGFDDGNNNKTLNITTKLEYRNGTFGRTHLALGSNEHWKNSENINFFKPKRKISLLLNQNNINEINFSQEDLLGIYSASGSSGGPRGGGPGGPRGGSRGSGGRNQYGSDNPAGNFLVDQKNGLNTVHSFGINYTAQFKKMDIVSSYFFNSTTSSVNTILAREYFTSDYALPDYYESTNSNSDNFNNRLNVRVDYRIDSANSILFIPRFSYQKNNSKTQLKGMYEENNVIQSLSNNNSTADFDAWNGGFSIFYRHAFHKRGRSFSISLSPTQNNSSPNTVLNTVDSFYQTPPIENIVNQTAGSSKVIKSIGASILYTEPIKKYAQLVTTIQLNNSNSTSEKNTFNIISNNPLLDSSLSNNFSSHYQTEAFGLNYRYNKNKINFSFANLFQFATLSVDKIFPPFPSQDNMYFSLLPNLSFQYKLKQNASLRLNYRTSNNPPTVEQLQELVINNNTLQLSIGNASLQQDFYQNLSIRYSSNSLKNQSSLFFVISGSDITNYISTNTIISNKDTIINDNVLLRAGSQLNQSINSTKHYQNIRSFANYSIPVSKIKTNLNFYSGINVSASPYSINNIEQLTTSFSWNNGVSLASNINPKLDFNLGYNSNYTHTNSDNNNLSTSNVLNHSINFRWVYQFWKGLTVRTEYNFTYNPNINSQIANRSFQLWNASLGYKFLKNEVAEVRLSIFDMLNQNNSISQNSNDLYVESSQNNNIKQYALLNFIYQIKKFKSSH